jgi:hypothetical protein
VRWLASPRNLNKQKTSVLKIANEFWRICIENRGNACEIWDGQGQRPLRRWDALFKNRGQGSERNWSIMREQRQPLKICLKGHICEWINNALK